MQILELVYSAIKLGCGMTLISRTGIESWFEIESLDGRKRDVIAELGSQLQKSVESKAVHWKLQQQQQQRSPTSPSRLRETVTLN